MREKYTTVDEDFSDFSGETRARLDIMRDQVRTLVPNVEERISYNIPGFFVGKKIVVYIAGYEHHTSIYPGRTLSDEYNKLAAEYASGQSTLKFPNSKPLPTELITQFIELRKSELGLG